jgi:hypothetical protein
MDTFRDIGVGGVESGIPTGGDGVIAIGCPGCIGFPQTDFGALDVSALMVASCC